MERKKIWLVVAAAVVLVVLVVICCLRQGHGHKIVISQDWLKAYSVVFTYSASYGQNEQILLIGYEARDWMGKAEPKSFLVIYRLSENGEDSPIYRFAPRVPGSVGYPRELRLERAWILRPKDDEIAILTSWGETGADYFGTHPIIFRPHRDSFKAANLYQGDLCEDQRIRDRQWTSRDFMVANYFDHSEKVKTILTQGISASKAGWVYLDFYADDQPKASQHKIERIRFRVL